MPITITPLPTLSIATAQRFWSKVDIPSESECWQWQAATTNGYGRFSIPPTWRMAPAHRISYELLVGPIPDGLTIDHLCLNRGCVNPSHLEPATHADNIVRSGNTTKTHCPNGHPYDDKNTGIDHSPNGRLRRRCKACKRDRARANRAAA